jgi:2,4-dienoyl-CoA reductase-like NADH-dependent reductase (Old Yellow Enzyme family)
MKSLFDQTLFAGMTLKNRFIRSATYDGLADESGHLTPELLKAYENLAKSGVGTIITGTAFISDYDIHWQFEMGISDDSFIEEYQKLTELVHQYGTRIIIQAVFAGSQTFPKDSSKIIPWGPSRMEDLSTKLMPKEMTKEEIRIVETAFANAALRAKKAGLDGIQIHAAHAYLLSKFLTPYYNRRTDEYGGVIENRARIIFETYQAMRDKVGTEFPILIKINCDDFVDQGMTFAESKVVCKKLAEAGIDAIEISGGSSVARKTNQSASRFNITPAQESYFKTYAAEIAAENHIPIILVGGNRDVEAMTDILNNTSIEYFALCRPLLREPNLIDRWQKGDLRKAICISCNKCFGTIGETKCIFNS